MIARVTERSGVEIDYCPECKGIWFDAGELELLLGNAPEAGQLFERMDHKSKVKEKKRKCPVCAKKMNKVSCGPEQNIIIDKCRLNHGIWLDHGELDALLAAGGLDDEHKTVNLLKDMFGKNRE